MVDFCRCCSLLLLCSSVLLLVGRLVALSCCRWLFCGMIWCSVCSRFWCSGMALLLLFAVLWKWDACCFAVAPLSAWFACAKGWLFLPDCTAACCWNCGRELHWLYLCCLAMLWYLSAMFLLDCFRPSVLLCYVLVGIRAGVALLWYAILCVLRLGLRRRLTDMSWSWRFLLADELTRLKVSIRTLICVVGILEDLVKTWYVSLTFSGDVFGVLGLPGKTVLGTGGWRGACSAVLPVWWDPLSYSAVILRRCDFRLFGG